MMITTPRFLSVAAILWVSLASVTAQSNWPEFRGPHGDGHAPDADLPVAIDESVVQWEREIPGKGWSSPVVWGSQIWLTTATEDGTELSVLCVDRRSGDMVHDITVLKNSDPAFCHPMNSYATPTPVIEEGRLYVHFGSDLTACLNTDTGDVIWKRTDLRCDHHRGAASSPILHDGKLYVAYDGFDVQYVVAFDKQTGETVWRTRRNIDYGTDNGDRMKAYGTGQIINVDGEEQLVYPSAVATIAYDPETGDQLWIAYHDGMNASSRPVYDGKLVYITNGMGSMVAVDPRGSGDVTGSHIAWSERKAVAKKSSQLLVDGLLYMNSDDGILSCRDPHSGDVHWMKRLGGEYAASPIYADGRIYFFSVEGDIITVKPGREFEALAETKLGDGFMASPAVLSDQMILRSKSKLYAVGP